MSAVCKLSPIGVAMSKSDVPRKTRLAVLERDNYACRRCGRHAGNTANIHHRAGREGIDPNCLGNLVLLCHACHEWAHRNPQQAYDDGWMIHRLRHVITQSVPVKDVLGCWFKLSADSNKWIGQT